jgi:eukaryotic-like serine/threonine-protein kinase
VAVVGRGPEEKQKESRAPKEAEKLRRRLQGDLDDIVLKALRKERHRRYTSVEQLSNDISRHLSSLPVTARPDTRRYRIAKFIQRNKAGVVVVALISLILIAGLAAVLWQAHVARLERAKAVRMNAFLQEMISYPAATGGSPNRKGAIPQFADMLDDAAERVETELKDQPEVRAEMLETSAALTWPLRNTTCRCVICARPTI